MDYNIILQIANLIINNIIVLALLLGLMLVFILIMVARIATLLEKISANIEEKDASN